MNVFTLNCFDEEFNDPKESLILSSRGHPCLRVWVGGFRPDLAMDNFCAIGGLISDLKRYLAGSCFDLGVLGL